jgi:hypothetical protein
MDAVGVVTRLQGENVDLVIDRLAGLHLTTKDAHSLVND